MNWFEQESNHWQEINLQIAKREIECLYKDEILKDWFINDLIIKDNKLLVNWERRIVSLESKEVKKRYRE